MSTATIVGIVGVFVLGIIFFGLSFIIPEKNNKKDDEKETEAKIKAMIDKEMDAAKGRIDDMVEETVNYSVEKTERALEKLSNEKIMAVNEYSDTVLKKISDNHNEAVFLYDMLNDKDEKLKTTGEEIKADKAALKVKEQELKKKEEEISEALEAEAEPEEISTPEPETKKEEAPVFTPFVPERIAINKDGEAVTIAPSSLVKEPAKKKPAVKKATTKEGSGAKTTSKATASKSTAAKNAGLESDSKKDASDVALHFDADKDGKKNSNELIKKLHDEGKSNMAIAKELGLGIGEVKLVIDLFASRK